MEEKAGNYKEYSNHFCLSETHLRKIHSIMEDYSKKIENGAYVSIYIARENDSFYETQDLEKIFLDENSSGKAIKTLSMEIITNADKDNNKTDKERQNAVIAFTKDKETKIRALTSYKSRDWCFLLIDELDSQIQRIIKEKPIPILKAKIFDLLIALGLLLSLAIGATLNLMEPAIDLQEIVSKSTEIKINFLVEQEINRNNSKRIWFIPIILIAMIGFISFLEIRPITRLARSSNASVFYWGDMIVKHDSYIQKISRFKWGVIIALLVSSASSLIFYFLP